MSTVLSADALKLLHQAAVLWSEVDPRLLNRKEQHRIPSAQERSALRLGVSERTHITEALGKPISLACPAGVTFAQDPSMHAEALQEVLLGLKRGSLSYIRPSLTSQSNSAIKSTLDGCSSPTWLEMPRSASEAPPAILI